MNGKTKAQYLDYLSKYAELNILPMFIVYWKEWSCNPTGVLNQIRETFCQQRVAVRSSSSREDGETISNAGVFNSILNIDVYSKYDLQKAIDSVFQSYCRSDEDLIKEHLFIQQMMLDVDASGVIFTKTLNEGAPYYVINYDDESGRTDTITGGIGCNKVVSVYRHVQKGDFDSKRIFKLVEFAKKIEKITGKSSLDIEFGMDSELNVSLFQVRPISTNIRKETVSPKIVEDNISHVISFLEQRFIQSSRLYGDKTILGVMPDWNPAEIIGITPYPLAASLYRELITRRVWSKAREKIGYRSMPPEELMVLVAGRPYIDVRLSFNSFIPGHLDSSIAEKLVTAWLDRLNSKPELHDKIEFDVAQTVMDFCFSQHLDKRYPKLLSNNEKRSFRSSLVKLTNYCLRLDRKGPLSRAELSIQLLKKRQKQRNTYREASLLGLTELIEECQELGTLPFSILARLAFITEALLRSAEVRGAMTSERISELKNSIETISGKMSCLFSEVIKGKESSNEFITEFGHLRPSTYDILSPCYKKRKELFTNATAVNNQKTTAPFVLTGKEREALQKLIEEASLGRVITPDGLIEFARRTIAGREYGKFVFTRNVAEILETIATWGGKNGFSRYDLAHLEVNDFINWNTISLLRSVDEYFGERINEGKKIVELGRKLQLGYLIRSERDVVIVPQHRSAPNFIGSGKAEGKIIVLDARSSCDVDLDGCIVCIQNADPGFDWIFARKISGLVTKFGGANSHMAIRCAEYTIPAAIGVGDLLYSKFSKFSTGIINSAERVLKGE